MVCGCLKLKETLQAHEKGQARQDHEEITSRSPGLQAYKANTPAKKEADEENNPSNGVLIYVRFPSHGALYSRWIL